MISLKRNYEIVLTDGFVNDEKLELVDIISLNNDILCGVFEIVIDLFDVFYDDNMREEVNYTAKIKLQIKVTIDLDNLDVKDFSLLKYNILNISLQRVGLLLHIDDMLNDYYAFEHCTDYTERFTPIVQLIEKGFEV